MRLKFATSLAVIIALLIPISTYAAGPKPGAKCTKAGLSQISNGKKYTCIKSGKSYVWNKGVVVPNPKPTPSSTPKTSEISESNIIKAGDQCTSADRGAIKSTSAGNFTCKHDGIGAYRWFTAETSTNPNLTPSATPSPTIENIDWGLTFNTDDGYKHLFKSGCQKEDNIASQWLDLQEGYFKYSNCIWPINVAKYVLGKQKPKSNLYINASAPIEKCAISEPANSSHHRGFMNNWPAGKQAAFANRPVPGPKMIIQVIPIVADDSAKPINSPEQDYKRFTDFVVDWAQHSSDQPSNFEVRFPKNYLKFNGKLSNYGIFHEARHDSPEHQRFSNDLVLQVDPFIDFTGVNLAIIVTTAGTPLSTLSQGTIGELNTKEGLVHTAATQFPYTVVDFNQIRFKNLALPYWWLHELYHSGFGLEHHDGDSLENINSEYGMGTWSLMSRGGGDLLAWDKWLVGFIGNSQVNCVAPSSSSVTWLAPSSVKTMHQKLTVIPISEYKVIAIESIRASGLYYKLEKESEGVMVYEIDLQQNFLYTGLKLVLPTNRDPNTGSFFLAQATLREGESVVTNGHRITVVESGNFGDVVKVEKA